MRSKNNTNHKYDDKICTICSDLLTEENFNEYNSFHAKYICIPCQENKDKQRYFANRDAIRKHQKSYELENKMKVIEAYGGKCVCCGETRFEFLTIDHINDDGAEERKNEKTGTGGKMYRWLIKNGFPQERYQLLCYNCNCAKGFFGYCPHKNEEQQIIDAT